MTILQIAVSVVTAVDSLVGAFNTSRDFNAANKAYAIFRENDFTDTTLVFDASMPADYVDANVYCCYGDWVYEQARYDEALMFSTRASEAAQRLGDENLMACSWSTLCAAYLQLGNHDKSLEYGMKCYEMDLKNHDDVGMSSSLNNLATISLKAGRLEEARDYIIGSLKIERTLGRSRNLAIRLSKASDIYKALGDEELAMQYAQEALELDQKDGRNDKSMIRMWQINSLLNWKVARQRSTLIQIILSTAVFFILCLILFFFNRKNKRLNRELSRQLTIKENLVTAIKDEPDCPCQDAGAVDEDVINFTPREMDIIRLSCEGLQYKEIADRLCISVKTVDATKSRVFKKIGINNTAELIRYAVKKGLVEL